MTDKLVSWYDYCYDHWNKNGEDPTHCVLCRAWNEFQNRWRRLRSIDT